MIGQGVPLVSCTAQLDLEVADAVDARVKFRREL